MQHASMKSWAWARIKIAVAAAAGLVIAGGGAPTITQVASDKPAVDKTVAAQPDRQKTTDMERNTNMAKDRKSAASPRLVNIVNFIRGVEPRNPNLDLLEPVTNQIRLVKQYDFPATFLLQYDALKQDRFVNLLKKELTDKQEIGVWLEMPQPLVEKAGIKWRGRFPWDWESHVDCPIGYPPAEREKMMDVLMADFKAAFGRYPRSVAAWVLDAHTLGYLADKYGIVAACNCKDQYGTDGYTLWGGYWNQAYYPSRKNAFMPAQNAANQIPVPIFRMLGSDPIYQYDAELFDGTNCKEVKAQGVVSLEPVYTSGGGGGDPKWVRWFFDALCNSPCLAFNYTQMGQENSFGWWAMKNGLTDQFQALAELSRKGLVRVETLEASGKWFKSQFPETPSTAFAALKDWKNQGRQSVWYNSRFYRANLFWHEKHFRIRDIHLFNELYVERYLTDTVKSSACTYDTLPVVDGYLWSAPDALAGIRLVQVKPGGQETEMAGGEPELREMSKDCLLVTWPVEAGGAMELLCERDAMTVRRTKPTERINWLLEISWAASKKPPIVEVAIDRIKFKHEGFDYELRCKTGRFIQVKDKPAIRIMPSNEQVALQMNCAK